MLSRLKWDARGPTLFRVKDRTLIYDGDCGFCRLWVERARQRDKHQRIEYLPCQSADRRLRFPQIREEDCLNAMYVVLPDGRSFSGADAAPHILDALPGWRWCACLFRLPGLLLVARPAYRFIARHRRQLGCHTDRCGLKH